MIGRLKRQDGYTIAEVLVVLAIIGLLAGLALPMAGSSVQKAREATLRSNLNTYRELIDEYYADHLEYPEELEALVEKGYVRELVPDTIEAEPRDWALVRDGENSEITDLRTRSRGVALDGSNYADW